MNSTDEPQMQPKSRSINLLGITRSKAKMIEYAVPEIHQKIDLSTNPSKLFRLCIGLIGDISAKINRQIDSEQTITKLQRQLLFAAQFFDAYLLTKLNPNIDNYTAIIGSATYYICNLPGSSRVLAKQYNPTEADPSADGIDLLLHSILTDQFSQEAIPEETIYTKICKEILENLGEFVRIGVRESELINAAIRLRRMAYESGTPRQLLFADIACAIIRLKITNSSWKALPKYSDLSSKNWSDQIKKSNFIKEFWPAQHLLGDNHVLRGDSAVVQMPTSAGKSKASELIIRSAFLSDKTELAVIIAPFRALCHEIRQSLARSFSGEQIKVDELSDSLQIDFDLSQLLSSKQILVVTPEKLLYALRHSPEMAKSIGVVIFDEGHQFDSGKRGITYELLITQLKGLLPEGSQKVLISAVIPNAEPIGKWLNGEESIIINGSDLIPTFRTIGFVSWKRLLGQIRYVNSSDPDIDDFFVPRIIESQNLPVKKLDKIDHPFPVKDESNSIALYLGIKLAKNGSIAIFCGKKATASKICKMAAEVFDRKPIWLQEPKQLCDPFELERLIYLYSSIFGKKSALTKSAAIGIFSHHSHIPHGIRIAIEHAMRENLIGFVVCTSTLAQGVNLPIRYLIVSKLQQSHEKISTRDFHNLIGRAGRAGMHTEGSIIFSDNRIYDGKNSSDPETEWDDVKQLLDKKFSKPCVSQLLTLFDPIQNDYKNRTQSLDAISFTKNYSNTKEYVRNLSQKIIDNNPDDGFSIEGVSRQISWKIDLICAVESHLLSIWDSADNELSENDIKRLAQNTLAHYLANESQKDAIESLFDAVSKRILQSAPDAEKRKIYGRTLFGIQQIIEIEKWLFQNIGELRSALSQDQLLEKIWPLLTAHIITSDFHKVENNSDLIQVAVAWINGKPLYEIHEYSISKFINIAWGQKFIKIKIDNIIEICEKAFSFDSTLILSALSDLLDDSDRDNEELAERLLLLQKQMKYGLPDISSISVYELGFADRGLSVALSSIIPAARKNSSIIRRLRSNPKSAIEIIKPFPAYYHEVLNRIIRDKE